VSKTPFTIIADQFEFYNKCLKGISDDCEQLNRRVEALEKVRA
jgi:hypothetical protein